MDNNLDQERETRIVIRNNKVIFENLTPEMLDVALALNPDDPDLILRKKQCEDSYAL